MVPESVLLNALLLEVHIEKNTTTVPKNPNMTSGEKFSYSIVPNP